jgi:hypothetical protein
LFARDLTGERFGMLTVQGVTNQRKNKCYVWECLCDCGNTTYLTTSALNSGNSQSCGCYNYNAIDLTGQRFGRLVVMKLSDIRKGKRNIRLWKCQCDCGKTAYVRSSSLRRGHTTSCGCYINEKQFVDLTGRKVGRLTVLKLSDTKLGKSIAWDCLCDCGNKTKVRMGCLKNETTKSCGCYGREINIKSLKSVSAKNYIENTSIRALGGKIRANNSSGTTGVSYDKSRQKWCALIGFKKKTYILGRYEKLDNAIKARKKAEDSLHGDFLEWYKNEYKS